MSENPPQEGGSELPVHVLNVALGDPIKCLFLTNPVGSVEHYVRGHGVPCRPEGRCPKELHRFGDLFYAYSAVEVYNEVRREWHKWVLRLTGNLHFHVQKMNLVGQVWSLKRMPGKGKRGEVVGSHTETMPPELVSPAFDVRPVLARLWGHNDFRLGVKNELPPPVMAAPVKRRAPIDDGTHAGVPEAEEPAHPDQYARLGEVLADVFMPEEEPEKKAVDPMLEAYQRRMLREAMKGHGSNGRKGGAR